MRLRLSIGVAVAAVTITLATGVTAQENYTQWSKYKVLTLTPQSTLSATVDSFPMLVRLNASNFTAQFDQDSSGVGGASIRFTDSTGTVRLPHQTERWNAAQQKAEIWVRVPRVLAGTASTRLRMYWGKADAADSSMGSQVFKSGNGFAGVWNMGDASGTTARPNQVAGGPVATLKNFTATYYPSGYTAPEGIIGLADTLTGGSCDSVLIYAGKPYIDLNANRTSYAPYNSLTSSGGTGFTWEGWYSDSTATQSGARYFVAAPDSFVSVAVTNNPGPTQVDGRIIIFRAGQTFTTRWNTNASPISTDPLGAGLLARQWQHLVATKDPGNVGVRFYINGVYRGIGTALTGSNDATRLYVQVGRSNCGNGSTVDTYLSGKVDALRLSTVVRDSNWVKLSFGTQCQAGVTNCPGTAPLTVGATVSMLPTALGAASSSTPDFTVKAQGAGAIFRIAESSPAAVKVMDVRGRVVWSGSFAPGARELSWNGAGVSSGLYVARLTVVGEKGVSSSVDRRLTLTR